MATVPTALADSTLAAMRTRATDGRHHEWGWYEDDVPLLIDEILALRAALAELLGEEA